MPNYFYGSLEDEIVVTAVCGKVAETATQTWDSGNNQDLMRREFLAQNFSLFLGSLKSLLYFYDL